VHAGRTLALYSLTAKRKTGIVSRVDPSWPNGVWPIIRKLFVHPLDEICEIMAAYDVSFSIGDGLRPGSIADANDEANFGELKAQGDLTKTSLGIGCSGDDEGPGHVPMHLIQENMEKQLTWCTRPPSIPRTSYYGYRSWV